MSETNPYSNARDDIAEMYGTKNDPKDYGRRTPPTIPVVEVIPVDVAVESIDVASDTDPEKLELLGTSELPLQFIISKETRELGLANIAKIREQLDRNKDV